jgi:hypothetical protein
MNKSFYFQHDYNSANDHKILFLRQQFGIEGFGIYWYVIEQLAQNNGILPLKIVPVIAMQIQTSADKVNAVIRNYELFEIQDEAFFSVRLLKQIEYRNQLSEDGRAGALKRWRNQAENSPPISIPNSTPNAKERKGDKGEESKVDKSLFGDCYLNGGDAWADITSDALFLERLVRIVRGTGATEENVLKATKYFLTLEDAKPEFDLRPRYEVRKHLVNWLSKQKKNVTTY